MMRYAVLLGLMLPLLAVAQEAGTDYELAPTPIGFSSVQEAYDSLSADSGARKSEYEGWTLFTQKAGGKYILWSFTPEDHPVHPSAVRREVVNQDGEVSISMDVLCYSSRFDCDQLVAQFQQINARIKDRLAADPG